MAERSSEPTVRVRDLQRIIDFWQKKQNAALSIARRDTIGVILDDLRELIRRERQHDRSRTEKP